MLDNTELPIKCGHCGRDTKKTVAWLKRNDTIVCTCGSRIKIDASQFIREAKKIEKAFDDLERAFKRFGR